MFNTFKFNTPMFIMGVLPTEWGVPLLLISTINSDGVVSLSSQLNSDKIISLESPLT